MLRAWHTTLQQASWTEEFDPSGPDRTVWASNSKARHIGELCEALDLLELLAHVDPAAWRDEVKQIWRIYSYHPLFANDSDGDAMLRPPNVGLKVCVTDLGDLSALWALLDRTYVFSSDYQRLRHALVVAATDRDPSPRPQLPIHITFEHTNPPLSFFRNVARYAARQESGDATQEHELWSHLVIQKLALYSSILTIDALESVVTAVEHGVELVVSDGLSLEWARDDMGQPSTIGTLLRAFAAHLTTTGRTTQTPMSSRDTCFSWLVVQLEDDPHAFRSVLSAVQVSKSLQHLVVDTDVERPASQDDVANRRAAWRWIAYVCFSRYATHVLEQLEFSLWTFSQDDLDAVRDVMLAEHPLAVLFNCPESSMATSHPEFLCGSVFSLVEPTQRDGSAVSDNSVFIPPVPIRVRVICCKESTTGWWRVLLPGTGEAWLHERDVVEEASMATTTNDSETFHSSRRIDIVIKNVNVMEPASELLKLLGPRIGALAFHEPRVWSSDWCRDVLACCPRIEKLSLIDPDIDVDLRALCDWYSSGICRATDVSIAVCESEHEPGQVEACLNEFCDEHSPLTMHVFAFRLDAFMDTDTNSIDVMAAVDTALRVLVTNRRLHTLEITFFVKKWVFDELDVASITASFDAYNGTLLPLRKAPLSLRAKVAFLSIVEGSRATWSQERLGSDVLAIVFGFAATCHARCVKVEFLGP